MTAPRKPAPTSARRVVMMTPPCHSACKPRLYEKDIGTGHGAKDTKELLRRGHSHGGGAALQSTSCWIGLFLRRCFVPKHFCPISITPFLPTHLRPYFMNDPLLETIP